VKRASKVEATAFLSPAKSQEDFAADVAELRRVLHYNPDTGVFTWACQLSYRGKIGDVAGAIDGNGYRMIGVRGRQLHAHRLAWLYIHGKWPEADIDHIDGVRSANRIANLRAVPRSVNAQNLKGPMRNSTTGFLGVTTDSRDGMFVVKIGLDGKHHYLGRYETAPEAHAAYLRAKRRLHEGCTL
jgi:hypothetical protein